MADTKKDIISNYEWGRPGMGSRDGAKRIAEERARQVEREGWSQDHDRNHADGELVDAAICYAKSAVGDTRGYWPWEERWWKPKSPIRDLERAGALIAAEIDRRLAEEEVRDGE